MLAGEYTFAVETLRAMKFSAGSLSTYKGRYARAAAMFEKFRADPGKFPLPKSRDRDDTR